MRELGENSTGKRVAHEEADDDVFHHFGGGISIRLRATINWEFSRQPIPGFESDGQDQHGYWQLQWEQHNQLTGRRARERIGQ